MPRRSQLQKELTSPLVFYSPKYDFKLLMCTLPFFIIMAQSFVTDENDLLFALENAESGNQLLDAIDAYLDGQVSYVE